MTKREFLDTVFALAPNEANAIMDAFDEYVESNVVPTGRSGKERRMTKYIIEIPDDVQYVLLNGQTDNKCYTAVRPIAELEELNSDYINEHYGELQDEAYQKGFEDGKKSVSEPDRIEVGDEVKVQTLGDGVYAVVGKAKCEDMECNPVTCYSLLCSKTGEVIEHDVKDDCTDEWEMPHKTGKHYDHISNLLEAMRT